MSEHPYAHLLSKRVRLVNDIIPHGFTKPAMKKGASVLVVGLAQDGSDIVVWENVYKRSEFARITDIEEEHTND